MGGGVEMRSSSPNPPSVDQDYHHHHHQQQYTTRREGVEVYVRGYLVPGLEMVVDEKGACVFADTGTTHPSPAALQSLLLLGEGGREGGALLKEGVNPVEFVYCNPYGDVSVEATFHLWGVRDRVVVSDIDGTFWEEWCVCLSLRVCVSGSSLPSSLPPSLPLLLQAPSPKATSAGTSTASTWAATTTPIKGFLASSPTCSKSTAFVLCI